MPEQITLQIPGKIDNNGDLRLNMVQLREMIKPYPNRNISITIEVFTDDDVHSMRSWYKNFVLPKVVHAWSEIGERYTEDQADKELRKLTTTCHKSDGTLSEIEDLDRPMLIQYLDEVKILASQNMNLVL